MSLSADCSQPSVCIAAHRSAARGRLRVIVYARLSSGVAAATAVASAATAQSEARPMTARWRREATVVVFVVVVATTDSASSLAGWLAGWRHRNILFLREVGLFLRELVRHSNGPGAQQNEHSPSHLSGLSVFPCTGAVPAGSARL